MNKRLVLVSVAFSALAFAGAAHATGVTTDTTTTVNKTFGNSKVKLNNTNTNKNTNTNTNTSRSSSAIGSGSRIGNTSVVNQAAKPAASAAFAPTVISSNDTCMGSISGGVSTVPVGISLGATWRDENCVMLKNSRELWNMGMRQAALARMCMDTENAKALEASGVECPNFEEIRARKEAAKKPAADKSTAQANEVRMAPEHYVGG